MKKMLLTLLAAPVLLWGQLHAQCLTNTSFAGASCPVVYSPDLCPTWSGSCNGWMISHGTPNLGTTTVTNTKAPTTRTTVFMWGAATEGEGMYTAYTFQAGQTYDVQLEFASSCTTTGHVNIYAMNGMTPHALTQCGNGYPAPNGQQIGRYTGNTSNADTYVTYTFTANGNYSQLWIYPDGAGSEGPSEYMMTFFQVKVCLSCADLIVYNSGTVPTGTTTAGTVQVGSSAGNAQPGIVGISSGQSTVLTAHQEIDLVQNFTATITGGGTFIAQIAPCDPAISIQASSTPIDSGTINPPQFESSKAGTALTGEGSALSDPAASKIRVYPTISAGTFTITGSAADLSNAIISVFDASGNTVYRLQNAGNTSVNLNLTPLGNGLYFVQINNGSKTITEKIIVQK